MTSKRNYGKIVHEGQGGFLNPPTHPEHEYCVHSTYGDTFWISLSSAAESEWLNAATKARAKGILNRWQPLPIEHPDVKQWIHQILGYFRNCYQSASGSWQAGELRILKAGDDPLPVDLHAGIHLIRKYYPEYQPTASDWNAAYWGTKVSA